MIDQIEPTVQNSIMETYGTEITIMAWVVGLLILVTIMSTWRMFARDGKQGWTAIIPIYNIVVLLDIIHEKTSKVIWILVPIVGPVILNWNIAHGLAKVYGKSKSFALFTFFLPFIAYPILAFTGTYEEENTYHKKRANVMALHGMNQFSNMKMGEMQTEEMGMNDMPQMMQPGRVKLEESSSDVIASNPQNNLLRGLKPVVSNVEITPTGIVEEIMPVMPVEEIPSGIVEEIIPVVPLETYNPYETVTANNAPIPEIPNIYQEPVTMPVADALSDFGDNTPITTLKPVVDMSTPTMNMNPYQMEDIIEIPKEVAVKEVSQDAQVGMNMYDDSFDSPVPLVPNYEVEEDVDDVVFNPQAELLSGHKVIVDEIQYEQASEPEVIVPIPVVPIPDTMMGMDVFNNPIMTPDTSAILKPVVEGNNATTYNNNGSLLRQSTREIENKKAEVVDGFKKCPSCGARVASHLHTCFLCGAKFDE